MYRVVSEESRPGFALPFEPLHGFFADEETAGKVTFAGIIGAADARPVTVDDAELEVLDDSGDAIGRYWLGRFELKPKNISPAPGGSASLEVPSCGGEPCPHEQAIWSRWRRGSILLGEWTRHPATQHGNWLHVVQNAWFTSGKHAMRCDTGDIVIDGQHWSSKDSFSCAIGEAANGPGGCFGSNLAALHDCVRSGSKAAQRYSVSWNAVETSRRALGDAFVTAVTEIFGQYNVEPR
ncbi:barstar family protein [Amycolatopsis sp. FU40]|uniref:barstar family protein n=1 Tax=Amycolatopsis sp. FU40 TaxID=2914159 RepID=UPI001F3E5D8B|nr:barstar family protein [Amycolatopsis sp. FU40]UKD60003.1 barstar family protein [Amycolatopsis sp. FU40]